MWKKIASLAAMLSASLTVSGCQTADLRPIVYKPIPTGRTGKVPQDVKEATRRPVVAPAPKKATRKPETAAVKQPASDSTIYIKPQRPNGYDMPIAK